MLVLMRLNHLPFQAQDEARDSCLFIVVAIGSTGDALPLAAIANALQERGHEVVFMAGILYQPLAESLGLRFEAVDTTQMGSHSMAKQDLHKAFSLMWHRVDQSNRIVFQRIQALSRPGHTTLVGSTLALGARLAQEKLGLPLATVHLSPACFLSSLEPPSFKAFHMPKWLPLPIRRATWWIVEHAVLDRICSGGLNRFRDELGLTPVRRVMGRWLHSPQRVIALFEPWFCPPQGDWPVNTVLAGFPRFDQMVLAGSTSGVPAGLAAFLKNEPPPIVFMTGSAMRRAGPFFAHAVETCRLLNARGILLTRHLAQVPSHLPGFMHHAIYAPLSEILPCAAALVSHGGIGTVVQGMAAGVPQLIMPYAHDQFDNAERLATLGVANRIAANSTATQMASALKLLLSSHEISSNCARFAMRLQNSDCATEKVLDRVCQIVVALIYSESKVTQDNKSILG